MLKIFQRKNREQNLEPEGFFILKIQYGEEEAWKLYELAEAGNVEAQLEIGTLFFDCSKPEVAFEWLVKASEQGNSEAYYYLWLMYEGECEGFEPDYQKADETLAIALKLKEPKAYYHLGEIYSNEDYDEHDLEKAFEYYLESAELGSFEAMEEVGNCYLEGKGVSQSDTDAFKWFSLSQKGKYGYNLAQCYLKGIGTQKDIEKGIWWLEQVFEKKGADLFFAEHELVDFYKAGYGGKDRLNKLKKVQEHIDEGTDLLMGLFSEEELAEASERKTQQEFNRSQVIEKLGSAMRCASSKDYEKAESILKKIADDGNSLGMAKLGELYLYANPSRWKNDTEYEDEAIDLLMKSAEDGCTEAYFQLAMIHRSGKFGIEKSDMRFYEYLKRAVDCGDMKAAMPLGDSYLNGIGTEKDIRRGVELLRIAADYGEKHAMEFLADCYATGKGVPISQEEESMWRKKAEQIRPNRWEDSIRYFPEQISIVLSQHR